MSWQEDTRAVLAATAEHLRRAQWLPVDAPLTVTTPADPEGVPYRPDLLPHLVVGDGAVRLAWRPPDDDRAAQDCGMRR